MIRKTIIVVLTLGAVSVTAISAMSYDTPLSPQQQSGVCAGRLLLCAQTEHSTGASPTAGAG